MGSEDKHNPTEIQEREKTVSSKLIEIFTILSINKKLNFIDNGQVGIPLSSGRKLLDIMSSGLSIPEISIPQGIFNKPSPLSDYFVPNTQIEAFIRLLTEGDSITRLNHVGLCYLVDSKTREGERLKEEVSNTNWNLYEEESRDLSDWFFLGNKTNWQDPLVEFVPSEMNNDKWRDYWLPHLSVDMDTNLSGEEIEKLVIQKFDGKVPPYRLIVVDGNICVIRARLGSISGINIYFDLGTATRGTRYHREHLLKLVV